MFRITWSWMPVTALPLTLLLAACGGGSGPDVESDAEGAMEAGNPAAHAPDLEDHGPEGVATPEWANAEPLSLSPEEIETIELKTARVEERALAARLPVMGRLMPHQRRRAIVSYPFSARIARIVVRTGDWVEPGDSLVVLQSEEVGVATAAFYSANADYELARVNHDRESQLFESGVAARKNLTSAETALRVAEANLNAAEKKLHVLGFTEEEIELLRETHQVNPTITLFSPIAGKVVENSAILGAMVDESTEILSIMDPTLLWAEAAVYEQDIARVRTGQEVEVVVPAYPDETFMGRLSFISDVLDPETRTITVRTEVPNPQQKLKPGMFADLTIELNQNGAATAVPSAAVLDEGGKSFVFVRVDSNLFEPRLVEVGASENGFVEIIAGLELGEEVVTDGNFQLKSKLFEAVLEAGHVH